MSVPHYAFEGEIVRYAVGKSRKLHYKVLFLPAALACRLPFAAHPRLRVRGEIADVPVAGAFIPGDGRRYFIVSPSVCRSAAVDVGSGVAMRFVVDEQDRVDVPAEIAAALARDEDLNACWRRLTPGRQRGLMHPIHAARSQPTREKRVLRALEAIMDMA